jgi:hypothetical protein
MRTTRSFSRTAVALVLLATLGACGGTEDATTASAPGQAGGGAQERTCFDAFPEAMGTPDLGNLTMLPEGWPEPPVEATLCQAFQESDGVRETIGYLTDGDHAADALDGYETILAGLATRSGDVLTGRSGDTTFEIGVLTPDSFTIELRR